MTNTSRLRYLRVYVAAVEKKSTEKSSLFLSFLRKKALKNQEKNPHIIPVPGVMQILKQRFT